MCENERDAKRKRPKVGALSLVVRYTNTSPNRVKKLSIIQLILNITNIMNEHVNVTTMAGQGPLFAEQTLYLTP